MSFIQQQCSYETSIQQSSLMITTGNNDLQSPDIIVDDDSILNDEDNYTGVDYMKSISSISDSFCTSDEEEIFFETTTDDEEKKNIENLDYESLVVGETETDYENSVDSSWAGSCNMLFDNIPPSDDAKDKNNEHEKIFTYRQSVTQSPTQSHDSKILKLPDGIIQCDYISHFSEQDMTTDNETSKSSSSSKKDKFYVTTFDDDDDKSNNDNITICNKSNNTNFITKNTKCIEKIFKKNNINIQEDTESNDILIDQSGDDRDIKELSEALNKHGNKILF